MDFVEFVLYDIQYTKARAQPWFIDYCCFIKTFQWCIDSVLSKSWLTDSDWISRGRFLLRYTLPRNLSSGDNDTVYGRPWGRFGVRRVSNASWERRVGMEAAQARCGSILVVWLITTRGNLNELFKIFIILQKVFILDQIVKDFTHRFLRCVLIADLKFFLSYNWISKTGSIYFCKDFLTLRGFKLFIGVLRVEQHNLIFYY